MTESKRLPLDYDFIIVGSGFGGSVSAMRLAEKGYRVCVIEQGKRFGAKDFPRTNWQIRKYLWMPLLKCFGIQNLSLFKNVLILSGCGVGGGSLVYANTLLEPGDCFYDSSSWSHLAHWKKELAFHFKTAKKMLGVTKNLYLTTIDEKLREISVELKCDSSFKSVDVGVFFGTPGQQGELVPDPYFGGKGPERAGCVLCGGCMVGCRHNAKNTLDKNYLWFAEKFGAVILPERKVYKIQPIQGGDNSGYEVWIERSTAWFKKDRKVLRARKVVLAAGVLGTVNLLLHCKNVLKTLPMISDQLGSNVRTNSEALVGVTARDSTHDFSKGIAITSGFYPDPNTHIEPVRYSKGSSFMKLLAAPMVDGGTRLTRPLKMVLACLLHPVDFLKLIFNWRWAETTVILLVMQTLDNKMRFKLTRNLFTLFRARMTTEVARNSKIPSYIPVAHTVARLLASKLNAMPLSAVNEVMLQIPTTAHILGGCCIGADTASGVIDSKHEVFHYPGLYVCDGSVIPANLGVNPSLTITAMSERCMNFIPEKND